MTKTKIVGKHHFVSKDGKDFYKLTVLEPLSPRQVESGCIGVNASDYFVDSALFNSIDNTAIQKMADFNVDFVVSNGRATIGSAVVA